MRFTITGASGFIGQRLIEKLRAEDHEVHLLLRKARPGLAPGVTFSLWDALGQEPMAEALESAEVVIHLAGEPVAQRWTKAVKERIRMSRWAGTRRLVQAMAMMPSPPRALISASAIGYYGSRGDEVLTEGSAAGEGFLAEVCREWEAAADLAEPLGTRVVKVRIGIVLGEQGGALGKMLPFFKAGLGGRIGSGQQWMSWIHVDDLVELLYFSAVNSRVEGPVNGVAPNPVRNVEFTEVLARTLGRPALFPAPPFALRMLYGEMADVLTGSQRVKPEAALEAGFAFRSAELGPALRSLVRE
ncbi:MAG: TIGR01777 family oxidoreductase [Bryobacteraceae bacterium]|nr:TIGR01777 family oxidoreductase [Bryobacteraceae bacterium]